MNNCLFFELLQIAIGNKRSLSVVPTRAQWTELFVFAKKQALVAISFKGISRLTENSDEFVHEIDPNTYMQWLGISAKMAQQNRVLTKACAELVNDYAHDGVSCCILKGQGNLINYPEDLREYRTPGDIDVWCEPMDPSGIEIAVSNLDGKGAHFETYRGHRAVVEYALLLHRTFDSVPKNGVRYQHVDAPLRDGVEVEIHFRPLYLDSYVRNCRLQQWFKDNAQFGICSGKLDDRVLPIPTNSFNAVYQMVHMYRHLFDEGIGLRQFLDYYFVLRALHIEQEESSDRTSGMAQWSDNMGIGVKSNTEIMHVLSRFGMRKFASAVMYVLQTVFAMPAQYMLCQPDGKEGKFLLDEILQAGNFGQFDTRIKHGGGPIAHAIEKTKHNFRLMAHYPEEVLWEPVFRIYHWLWRRFEWWRFE